MDTSTHHFFDNLTDPRLTARCKYPLRNIVFIAFCTFLSNGEDYADMVTFAKHRKEWLSTILDMSSGVPSHDTFARVFQLLDSKELTKCLQEDGQRLIDCVKGKLVSFDGKKIKGESPNSKGNEGLFILNAFVSENGVCLGQEKVEGKSNEITAIPKLIDSLALEGCTVSIDAIGCQTAIAKKITSAGAHYLLAVKQNQKGLYEAINDDFAWKSYTSLNVEYDCGHGRYEIRKCQIAPASDFLDEKTLEKWVGIKTIVKLVSERTEKGITTLSTRYYISSKVEDCAYYNANVRAHWGIENRLHWHLDVTFKEDACRCRKGNSAENLSILRKIALQRIRRVDDKASLKKRRYKASLDEEFLEKVINL